MKRIIGTLVWLGSLWILNTWVLSILEVAQAQAAVGQLADDNLAYATSRAASRGSVEMASGLLLVVGLLVIWWKPVRVWVGGLSLALLLLGCGPIQREIYQEIKPNETAFVIPLEGATKAGQDKFFSEAFLADHKVATKRITIPTRKLVTGRGPGSFTYIPTVQIITLDRSPLVREWTKAPTSGTAVSDQAIRVESRESIDFLLGVNASASITEDDAATFLYYFNGRSLAEIMDTNLRGFVQRELFNEFGIRSLEEGRLAKKEIFSIIETKAKAFFQPQGLTIAFIGGAEGLTYTDGKIQESINRVFQAARDAETAEQEYKAQQTRNKTIVEKAQADSEARRLQAVALAQNPRLIELEAVAKWDGKLPQFTGGDGAMPFIGLPR